MKQWIIKAGLVNNNIMDQCVIVYEPDCASLAIQKEYFQPNLQVTDHEEISNPTDDPEYIDEKEEKVESSDGFQVGDKYVLIDAGGGTVDIACHQILDNGSVEEIVYPTGDKWGSCYIDDLYIKLLEEIFSKEWIDFYKKDQPAGFVEIME
eukprot:984362_1